MRKKNKEQGKKTLGKAATFLYTPKSMTSYIPFDRELEGESKTRGRESAESLRRPLLSFRSVYVTFRAVDEYCSSGMHSSVLGRMFVTDENEEE